MGWLIVFAAIAVAFALYIFKPSVLPMPAYFKESVEVTAMQGESFVIVEALSPLDSWVNTDILISMPEGITMLRKYFWSEKEYFIPYNKIDNISIERGAFTNYIKIKETGWSNWTTDFCFKIPETGDKAYNYFASKGVIVSKDSKLTNYIEVE